MKRVTKLTIRNALCLFGALSAFIFLCSRFWGILVIIAVCVVFSTVIVARILAGEGK